MIWLTRDTLPDGTLAPWIDVWDLEPTRDTSYHANGAVWVSKYKGGNNIRGRIEMLSPSECKRDYGVVPITDREQIAVGRKR